MYQIPELLAPAGGPQQVKAAIENGADAVYLGGKQFNARQNAANFDDSELREAIEYCHIRGANLYITLNTLINDAEMQEALEYANFAYEAGADALIIQDLGFARCVKSIFPDLPIHLSTQCTIYNLEGVNIAERIGASRVVLARELSINEISEVAEGSNIELEVFTHGALCQCYSGQCYMSSMIGGRSGNRGNCAQPCRLPYSISIDKNNIHKSITEKGYYLSPKDLCTIEHLDKLIMSGIKCLKIEGRMKSPEYVAIVTGIYRKYLDLYKNHHEQKAVSSQDIENLQQIYNRGGFTTGYLLSRPGRDLITRGRAKHWGTYLGEVVGQNENKRYVDILLEDDLSMGDGIEIVNNNLPGNIVTMMQKKRQKILHGRKGEVITIGYIDGKVKKGDPVYKISDKALNRSTQETFSGKSIKKISVTGHLKATENEYLRFSAKDEDGNKVTLESHFIPERALNRPLNPEAAMVQISKTGSTPFRIENCYFDIGNNLSVPLSELNSIRREALDKLTELRKDRYPNRKALQIRIDKNSFNTASTTSFSVYLYKWPDANELFNIDAERIYVPIISLLHKQHISIISELKAKAIQVYAWVPPVTKGETEKYLKDNAKVFKYIGIDGIMIGNLSHIEIFTGSGLPLAGDYSLNIYNSQSIKAASDLGLNGLTLSHELTVSEMKNIDNCGIGLEATVYGRVPVMISEHCPIGSEVSNKSDSIKCGLCERGKYYLKDRTGAEFPVIGDPISCRSTVLNCNKLYAPESVHQLSKSGVGIFRLYIYDETLYETNQILTLFRNASKGA